jgi:hypothetical protein
LNGVGEAASGYNAGTMDFEVVGEISDIEIKRFLDD